MRTDWLHRTNKGKVVYERKPHAWNTKDVIRVARSSDIVFFNIPKIDWETLQEEFETWITDRSADFEGFGGGVFSGGGATRNWEEAPPEEVKSSIDKGIIVLIRGDE